MSRKRTVLSALALKMNTELVNLIPQLREDLIVFGTAGVTLEDGTAKRVEPQSIRAVGVVSLVGKHGS